MSYSSFGFLTFKVTLTDDSFQDYCHQRIQPTFDHESVTGPYLPIIDREGFRDLMERGSRLANSPLRFTTDEECKHRMKYNVLFNLSLPRSDCQFSPPGALHFPIDTF